MGIKYAIAFALLLMCLAYAATGAQEGAGGIAGADASVAGIENSGGIAITENAGAAANATRLDGTGASGIASAAAGGSAGAAGNDAGLENAGNAAGTSANAAGAGEIAAGSTGAGGTANAEDDVLASSTIENMDGPAIGSTGTLGGQEAGVGAAGANAGADAGIANAEVANAGDAGADALAGGVVGGNAQGGLGEGQAYAIQGDANNVYAEVRVLSAQQAQELGGQREAYFWGADDGEGNGWMLPQTCSNDAMGSLAVLSFIGLIATCALVALAYMFSKVVENPRIANWCKTEVWQVFATALVVVGIYAALALFCVATPAQLGVFVGMGSGDYARNLERSFGEGNQGMYAATQGYLENLASYAKGTVSAIRYNMGAYELRSGIQKYKCEVFCFIAGAGRSYAPYGGESSHISLLGNLLSIATIALLSILFQLFLLLYIDNGLFLVFLPIAIVVRSLPFMRGFGSTLIALVLSLYIMYPLMLYVDGIVFPNAAAQMGLVLNNRLDPYSGPVSPILGQVENNPPGGGEDSLEYRAFSQAEEREVDEDIPRLIGIVSMVFIAGVFAAALNFVVIAAIAREIARTLGEELDISRLGQML